MAESKLNILINLKGSAAEKTAALSKSINASLNKVTEAGKKTTGNFAKLSKALSTYTSMLRPAAQSTAAAVAPTNALGQSMGKLGVGINSVATASQKAAPKVKAVETNVKKLASSSQLVTRATRSASRVLTSFGRTAAIADGPLGAVAGRVNALATALRTVPLPSLLAGAAINALIRTFLTSLEAGAAFEQQMLRLDAVLEATGNRVGVTSQEINNMASALGEATLTTAGEARTAAAALATFGGVNRDNFEKTLNLAQDLSVVMGGDLKNNVIRLGRILEAPTRAFSSLRRAGIQFTDQEKELVTSFVEVGNLAEAQAVIFEKLGRVTDVAKGEAQGYAGAMDTLGERITRTFVAIGNFEVADVSIVTGATTAVNLLSKAFLGLSGFINKANATPFNPEALDVLTDKSLDELFEQKTEELSDTDSVYKLIQADIAEINRLEAEGGVIAKIRIGLLNNGLVARTNDLEVQRKSVVGLVKELDAIRAIQDERAATSAEGGVVAGESLADTQKKTADNSIRLAKQTDKRIVDAAIARNVQLNRIAKEEFRLGVISAQDLQKVQADNAATVTDLEESQIERRLGNANAIIEIEQKLVDEFAKGGITTTVALQNALAEREKYELQLTVLTNRREGEELKARKVLTTGINSAVTALQEGQARIDELRNGGTGEVADSGVTDQIRELETLIDEYGSFIADVNGRTADAILADLKLLEASQNDISALAKRIEVENSTLGQKTSAILAEVEKGVLSELEARESLVGIQREQVQLDEERILAQMAMTEQAGDVEGLLALRDMLETTRETAAEFENADWWDDQKEGVKETSQEVDKLGDAIESKIGGAFSKAFDTAIDGSETLRESINGTFADIATQIKRQAIRQGISQAFASGAGGDGGGASAGLAGVRLADGGLVQNSRVIRGSTSVTIANGQYPAGLGTTTRFLSPGRFRNVMTSSSVPKYANGGLVRTPYGLNSVVHPSHALKKYADGGLVRGPGTGRSDDILARISNMEYVMPAKITKQFLPILEIMRQGKFESFLAGAAVNNPKIHIPKTPNFADGGLAVSPSASPNAMSMANVTMNITSPDAAGFVRSQGAIIKRMRTSLNRNE